MDTGAFGTNLMGFTVGVLKTRGGRKVKQKGEGQEYKEESHFNF